MVHAPKHSPCVNDVDFHQTALQYMIDAYENDPSIMYLTNQTTHYHQKKASHILDINLKYGKRFGIIKSSTDKKAISIWLPPNHNTISTFHYTRLGAYKLPFTIDLKVIERLTLYGDYCLQMREKSIKKPHWYLSILVVSPDMQGKGISKEVTRQMYAYFDETKQACYLETHKEKNVEYYKRFGFEVKQDGYIPGTTIRQWGLVREAR